MARSDDLIRTLRLQRHPERGYFVETYRAQLGIASSAHDGARAASTAIYFLLTAEDATTYLHRLRSDELFHLYEGGPLDVLLLDGGGHAEVRRLGLDLAAGERPQIVIPAGTWVAAELVPGASHCLWGCTVAPGFEFRDFELAEGPELAARFPGRPDLAARIARMTRPRNLNQSP
jgi:predicted cupin superfamily sugar epimerase